MNGVGGFVALRAALNGDYRPRLPNGQLVSKRRGFGAMAKLMRQRAKQFSKREARQHRKLMRQVRL